MTPNQLPAGKRWKARKICCGRDCGYEVFDTWEQADAFRDAYTSGYAVAPHGYSDTEHWGHKRAVIIERMMTNSEGVCE